MTEAKWEATGGYLVDGVIEMADGSFVENKKFVDPEVYWKHIADQTPIPFIYDNSYVKVREITLAYRLPKRWISKVFDAVSVSFVARNPFIIYKNVPNIDRIPTTTTVREWDWNTARCHPEEAMVSMLT